MPCATRRPAIRLLTCRRGAPPARKGGRCAGRGGPEENRKIVKLGTIAITALEANAVCDQKTSDPVINLPEGVAGPANDPLFAIRPPPHPLSRPRRPPGSDG